MLRLVGIFVLLAAEPKGVEGFFGLVVNTVAKDPVLVTMRDGDVLMARDDLLAVGIDLDGAPGQTVSLNALRPWLSYRLDEQTLTLHLTVKPERLPKRDIDFQVGPPIGLKQVQGTSAYVNYSLRLADFVGFSAAAEAGVSVLGAFLYSSMQLSSDRWTPVRGLSHLIIDNPKRLERWTIGDHVINGGTLGGAALLGGVTFGRNFDLDPYFMRRPALQYSGVATLPSTMDLYVNDQLVRREQIAPGAFTVRNVPAMIGSGQYRYVLRDAFGRTSDVESPYYLGRELLPTGVNDYSVSLGFARRNLATESFDYGGGLAYMASIRRGFTDWLTGGGRFEGSYDMFSAGSTWAVRTLAGELALSGAGSFDTGHFGAAGALTYGYLSRVFSAGAFARGLSPYYSTLSVRADADRPLLDSGITASLPIPAAQLAFTLGLSATIMRDSGLRKTATGSFFARLGKIVTLNSSCVLSVDQANVLGYSVFTSVAVQLDNYVMAAVNLSNRDGQADVLATITRSAPLGAGVGYQARVGLNPDRGVRLGAQAQYQSPFGVHFASYDYVDGQHHPMFETRGGVTWVHNGGLHASRPVATGFATVEVPNVEGVRVFLNNQEIGRTDGSGRLLVPGLLPYYGNRISIADVDVPLTYRLDATEQVVAGPIGGGILVVFEATSVHYVRGVWQVRKGMQWVPASDGELSLRPQSGPTIVVPLGRDGRYELDSPPPGDYVVNIDWIGGKCETSLTIPTGTETIVDLGVGRCGQ